jgi:type II secretory pathway pseudopilin PulG
MEKNKKEKGVSLIELILAIGVFVVSSATVAHLFIGSQTSINYSVEKVQGIFLAKQGIEEVRAVKNTGFENVIPRTNTETVTLNGKDFERTVAVSFYSAQVIEVNSTIEWETAGKEESISYSEFVTKWETVVE